MIITGALTRCSDAAHLNGAGHMTSCSTLWVYEGPLLSSNQVTWYTLKHTEKVQLLSVLIENKTPWKHTQCDLSPHTNTLGHMKRLWCLHRSTVTYSIVALLKDLVGQQLQGATVHTRLSSQVALDGMVGFTTVSWPSVENHLPLDGTCLGVPGEHINMVW